MCVWRWDKKEPVLRFPLKDQLNVFRVAESAKEPSTSNLVAAGSKKGTLTVWLGTTGKILYEIESAHYMEIMTLDISSDTCDFIITGGKDCKVKLWRLGECYHEFSEHQQEVTQV
jgi:WD40 repeat protein